MKIDIDKEELKKMGLYHSPDKVKMALVTGVITLGLFLVFLVVFLKLLF